MLTLIRSRWCTWIVIVVVLILLGRNFSFGVLYRYVLCESDIFEYFFVYIILWQYLFVFFQVRLDIWYFMRRIFSVCIIESYVFYFQFMRRFFGCIFYWSEEDFVVLKLVKEIQVMKEGMIVQGKEQEWFIKKELVFYCRRIIRSFVEIRQQINELFEVFFGEQGRDMLGTLFLDVDKVRDVWESQQRYVDCIQDFFNVFLYIQTGIFKKGIKILFTYRCVRGFIFLEFFYLYLNRFIFGEFIVCGLDLNNLFCFC